MANPFGRLRGRRVFAWLRHRRYWWNRTHSGETYTRVTSAGDVRVTSEGDTRVAVGSYE